MTPLLALLGPAVTVLVAVIGALFGRAVFKRLDDMAADLKDVKGQVGSHAERLARVETKVETLERWRDRGDRGAA